MNERLLLKARFAEAKKRLKEMELKADAYISIIRDIIDPYAGDYIDFDIDKAVVIMGDFHKLWTEARELKAQIAKMEKDLNG